MLQLRLFGAPEVLLDGEPVRFDTRKAVALLAYLAVTGRPQQRDVLAALLWPELDQTKARGALRRTLSVASGVGPALKAEQKVVWLDAAMAECDVEQFGAASGSSDLKELRAAVDLAAEPFMAGFSLRDSPAFDDWQAMVGDELRDQLSALLGHLVDAETARGELEAAAADARRRVAVDPLSEPAHVDLIRVTAMAGDRPGALRHFRSLVRVLDHELGVPPLPETVALHDDIRAGRMPEPVAAHRPLPSDQDAEMAAPTPARRCVGRTRERGMLQDAWRAAAASGAVRGVVGDPGMGRTTL
ncbi:MAG: BTAD domain-containing putative transcriptional regulator, partial [Actinomycetes bacterium]